MSKTVKDAGLMAALGPVPAGWTYICACGDTVVTEEGEEAERIIVVQFPPRDRNLRLLGRGMVVPGWNVTHGKCGHVKFVRRGDSFPLSKEFLEQEYPFTDVADLISDAEAFVQTFFCRH